MTRSCGIVWRVFQWGLIGAGDVVRKRVAAALRESPGSELVAVSRGRVELAEAFAVSVGARRWYADWHDLLADAEVDGVYIATPVHVHAAQTIAAANAGKHVLCEKPMAMNVAECDRMISACRANGVKLGIAYYRHLYPIVARIKDVLESGEIGRAVVVQINAFERFNPTADHPRYWFVKSGQAGGGPMMDFGCHRVEVLLTLFGAVEHVRSAVANIVFDREVEDTAAVVLQFQDGPCAIVTVTHAAMETQDTLDIFATDGSIHIPTLNAGAMRVVTPRGERIETHAAAANLHAPLVEDFVRAVSDGREPAVIGETGRMVAAIEDAIYGRSVWTSPGVRRYVGNPEMKETR
jgi:predicted dehydrogenase